MNKKNDVITKTNKAIKEHRDSFIDNVKNHKALTAVICIALVIFIVASIVIAVSGNISPKEFELGSESAKLSAYFIDVGQGDCTIFESDGEFVLVDAGEKDYGSLVVEYLEDHGADSLKYVIATHPHTDHIGGLKKVINNIKTENFITVETDQSIYTWLNVLDAVEKNDVNCIDAEVGATYSFGSSEFTILAPLSDEYDGYNDYSVVAKFSCGDISFLMTGDAGIQSESEMLDAGEDLKADVLKCGHHGSSKSSSEEFLKAVDPEYAVISCGKNNDYGHPHKETISKLEKLGCTYYRTDELGTIVARTDGVSLSFSYGGGQLEKAEKPAEAATPEYYVGNKNSFVFHRPECDGAKSMSDKNKIMINTREEALELGYHPCPQCEP